jgi:HTH-type transcriptional regulator, sugar sensing transcriptional regulator
MKVENVLKKLGFSENETRVYLSALESGLASAQDIAANAGIKRTTTYSVLSYLVNRGIVARTKVKNKNRFLVEPPEKLLNLVNEMQENIKKSLPELNAIYNKSDIKPKITFYEGESAIQKIYDDTIDEKPTEILEWNTDAYFLSQFVDPNYIKKRIAFDIKARRIACKDSKWDTEHKKKDKEEYSETLIVPKEVFDPQIEVNIYNNKVSFMNYAENMSVIIESKPIADAMRQAYELSWKGAETYKK